MYDEVGARLWPGNDQGVEYMPHHEVKLGMP